MYPDNEMCVACHLPGGSTKKDHPNGYWCPWCGYMLVKPKNIENLTAEASEFKKTMKNAEGSFGMDIKVK